ncbi:cerebellin-1-like [Mytilus galloprovincialis]|uniref:cerebellin-1-like n=1 Tax=Mytilus galloprovincialis TaxID=29158 RepID=UPI003F7B8709
MSFLMVTTVITCTLSLLLIPVQGNTCTGNSDCENIVTMPLLDNMRATLKADLDVRNMNDHLKTYIASEIKKGFENAMNDVMNQIVNKGIEEINGTITAAIKESLADDDKAAFLARLENNLSSLSKHSTLIFQTVLTNIGDGYNPSNGVFTSKRKGVYFFSWSTLTKIGNMFPTEIVLNGNQVGVKNHGYGNRHSDRNQPSTQNAVVAMQNGDRVWIRASINNGYCFADQWTSFSGFEI